MSYNNPTANIAVNKNVVKQYGHNVYLNDGTEYQFELFNPTQDTVAAEINLDGKQALEQLLVLRPGERIWLECDPETKRKFRFETYNVSGNNKQVEQAIRNNGDVEARFYRERRRQSIVTTPYFEPGVDRTVTKFDIVGNQLSFTTNSNVSELSAPVYRNRGHKETGRTEQGGHSGQTFYHVDKEFDMFSFHVVSYKILPASQKPAYRKDVVKGAKTYCPQCGSKIRKASWKFCPTCGDRL